MKFNRKCSYRKDPFRQILPYRYFVRGLGVYSEAPVVLFESSRGWRRPELVPMKSGGLRAACHTLRGPGLRQPSSRYLSIGRLADDNGNRIDSKARGPAPSPA